MQLAPVPMWHHDYIQFVDHRRWGQHGPHGHLHGSHTHLHGLHGLAFGLKGLVMNVLSPHDNHYLSVI